MTSAKDLAFLTVRLAAGVFEGVSLVTELFRVVFRAGVFAARVTGGSMFSKELSKNHISSMSNKCSITVGVTFSTARTIGTSECD